MTYYVYIVRCKDGALYTGTTPDLGKRLRRHHAGTGAKYTRGRGPLVLVYSVEYKDRSEALRREYAIKQLSRAEKLRLIACREQ